MIKWQTIPYSFREVALFGRSKYVEIRHYKYLKPLGARLHRNDIICEWEFRFAYLVIGLQFSHHALKTISHIKIYIPFMKKDKGMTLRLWQE